ncbi:MAG TPA: VTT domain-containing protein [Candidatus Paceibacterota bacterium]|nr:VTT domain-containing protein [Candidatus Paceibacterota bacterium]
MVESLIAFLHRLADALPVIPFSFIASLVEEIVSPIPSPLVMTTVGSALATRHDTAWYIFVGTVFAATCGKVLGYWGIYILSDKLEDLFLNRFGRKIGVSHAQIEAVGKMFSRTWRDDAFVFIVRFLPVLPSAPITVTAGLIKLPLKNFLLFSFLGTMCRNIMYLGIGYFGVGFFRGFAAGVERSESLLQFAFLLFLGAIVLWAYRQRHKHLPALKRIFQKREHPDDGQGNPVP